MAITDEGSGNGFFMPVAPAYAGGSQGGFGGWGGDWGWIILLLLLAGNGGWGMGGFGMGGAMMGMDYGLYPWLNNSQHISDGFRDQMLQTSVSSIGDRITTGFGDVQNSLCSGFAGVNASITGAQMANMQSIFGLQSALQQCCCDNRAATQDLKYTLATEACATRAASTQNTQAILDKLCQLELDGYKRENDSLRSQLSAANLAASQTRQTADIQSSIINELRACPIPSQPVYGNQAIFSCQPSYNSGCGCGCGG